MKKYETFLNEQKIEPSILDYAWLYFLVYVYGGELDQLWASDNRMGVPCREALNKFDCVFNSGKQFISKDNAKDIVDAQFRKKTILQSMKLGLTYKKYDSHGYDISEIPINLFLSNNPNVEKAFSRIKDRITDHFNSMGTYTQILEKLSKSRRLKEFNQMQIFRKYDKIPQELTIYRGLRTEYDKNKENDFSCWTTDIKQAEKFAKYKFTGKFQERILAENPHILETTISVKDIVVFIGGDESEVVMRNPIIINKITKL